MKIKILNKLLLFAIVITLMTSLVVPITAETYDSEDTHSGHIEPSDTTVEVADAFNITLYINTGGDTTNAFTVRQLFWNATFAQVTTNPGGTMNENLNSSFYYPWTTGSDDGNLNNTDGELDYGPQAFTGGLTTTGNITAAVVNFSAVSPGACYIYIPYSSFGGNSGLDIAGGAADFWTNTTVRIYPQNMTNLVASAYNYTAINLTWTNNVEGDNTTLCGKAGSYPTGPSDSVLYNGSNISYNHTGLNNCTTYFYRAWSYNESSGWHSLDNKSAYATTQCFTNISFVGVLPVNGSTTTNCTYDLTPNVTIRNSKGRTCLYWINASDGSTTSGSVLNNSVTISMTGLNHNTTYWWNVSAAENGVYGSGDSAQVSYNFKTGIGGGNNPSANYPGPSNGATSIDPYGLTFNVTVTDSDTEPDPMEVTFYWANGSVIGVDTFTPSGASASTTFDTFALAFNTTYQWYTYVNDTAGCDTIRQPSSGYYSFTTDEALTHITKEWAVCTNNTIIEWINVTNVGEIDLSGGYINNTYDYLNLVKTHYGTSNDTGDTGKYTINWLNTSYPNKRYNITAYFNLTRPVPNGTSFSDTVKSIFNGSTLNTYTPTDLPTMCYYATKEANMSTTQWNTTHVRFWINVTNCGDFYLNFVRLNETYSPNLSYVSSNYPGNETGETFNITQIAPGATNLTEIVVNTSYTWDKQIPNGTKLYNNITIHANETSDELETTMYLYAGAVTERIKVIYTTVYYDVLATSDTVFTIIGVALMIMAIMAVVVGMYMYRQNEW